MQSVSLALQQLVQVLSQASLDLRPRKSNTALPGTELCRIIESEVLPAAQRLRSEIEAAIQSKGLVVVETMRRVYWNGAEVPGKWSTRNREWQLLTALAATRGLALVREDDIYGDVQLCGSGFAKLKNSLCNMLPSELRTAIHAVRHVELYYQLQLPSNQIHLFRMPRVKSVAKGASESTQSAH